MTEQDIIRWARQSHPDDPNIIEAGTDEESAESLTYIWDELLAEGEQG